MYALRMGELMGTVFSRISTIFMVSPGMRDHRQCRTTAPMPDFLPSMPAKHRP
jgi:hypothetical protein